MRIGIREQLGLLVLLTTLVALAVVAIATWVNNYGFVLEISSSALSLTASLYANQLTGELLLLQSSVAALSTRVLLQSALQRYESGNNTIANWARATQDLQSSLSGVGAATMLLQLQVFSRNGSGEGGPYGLLNVTGPEIDGTIPLPFPMDDDGATVYLGNNGTGYPSNLYPNLTFESTALNSTYNTTETFYDGSPLYSNTSLVLGPWLLNSSFALMSITVPIINNTSTRDPLGWLSTVVDARNILGIARSSEGLGKSGQVLIVSPSTVNQKLPATFGGGIGERPVDRTLAENQSVGFVIPPLPSFSRSGSPSPYLFTSPNSSFQMQAYPAVLSAYTSDVTMNNGAGSLINTRNEEAEQISVGFAMCTSKMVNWALLAEQSHSEVTAPIRHLREILLACVFGTVGVLILVLVPVAHFSVRPIRRLREATERTVEPERYVSDDESQFTSESEVSTVEHLGEAQATNNDSRKGGFINLMTSWRGKGRNSRRRQPERDRSETFRIPGKVQQRRHWVQDELTDLTRTYNEMSERLTRQYVDLEEKVKDRTRELEMSKQAAEVANETKTLFIANISHELKTPLNGILGMCAVCMQETDPVRLKRSLGIIYKSGDLLLHLLTDLLTFTKNQVGQQITLDEREFRLADVSSQLVSIFEKQAKEGHIDLRVTYQGPCADLGPAAEVTSQGDCGPHGTGRIRDMVLWGDQHRILQVIINLVSNSLKFTPKNGNVDVRIRCLGDAPERTQSRKETPSSKRLKHTPSRGSRKKRGRIPSASGSFTSMVSRGREGRTHSDTALEIKAGDPRAASSVNIREMSPTPSCRPFYSRALLFEFEVEDTGPGIPDDQQQRVFEPFMQGDLGLSKKYGGTGLGLSICSQLATLMKGDIQLESQVGKGSRFTMRIPLAFVKERADSTTSSRAVSRRNSGNVLDAVDGCTESIRPQLSPKTSGSSGCSRPPVTNGLDTATKPRLVGLSQPFFAAASPIESADQQLEAIERVTAQVSTQGGKIRVLVAEDNKINQEVVLRMLKLEDIYDVTVAKDGKEALDLVKESMETQKLFSLIFMDVQMPNLDGIQSTRLIREMGYSAPIVALTAFAEESNKKECKESGMNDFLAKPIKRPELKKVLKQFCATIPEAPEESPSQKESF